MRFFLALAFSVLLVSSASAQMIDKLTVENVGAAINAAGFRYVETRDNRGYPLLQIEIGDEIDAVNVNVLFYGCAANDQCEDITLFGYFEPPRPLPASAYHVWNDVFRQARNWTRAYADEEGDTILVMNINATGGLGSDALTILLSSYLIEARDFGLYIAGDQ